MSTAPPRPLLYPAAKWTPLANHSSPGSIKQRNLVVLHITEGSTAEGAIAWFRQSVAPHRISAHFVIDRDGTVYQLIDVNDTAWHASQCNSRSIGIEHAAIAVKLMATEAQYVASAALVKWCCDQMGVPVDRAHVMPHSEASPADGHVQCCGGAMDVDEVVRRAAGG